MISLKTCTKCGGEPKPLAEFYKDASKCDGLRSQCKVCLAAWYVDNRNNVLAVHAKWRAANPEKVRKGKVKYRAAHPEKESARVAKWAAANPEAVRIKSQNRRARKRDAGGKLSVDIAERLFVLQRGKCACGCGQPLGAYYHRDHIMPLALGGANEDWNIQLLRQRCNNQKHAKHPVEFMQQRGFLL